MALTFLSFEELPEDEQPPKSIWLNGEKMREHFERVKKHRNEKYGGGGNSSIEDPVDNDAAKNLISG